MVTAPEQVKPYSGDSPFAPRSLDASKVGDRRYSRMSASELLLKDATLDFGVTRWALAQMLGCPHQNYIYIWGRRSTISQFYMVRLAHLYSLRHRGKLDIGAFDGRTYWDSFRVPLDAG